MRLTEEQKKDYYKAMDEKAIYFEAFLKTEKGIEKYARLLTGEKKRRLEMISVFNLIMLFNIDDKYQSITSGLRTYNYPRFKAIKNRTDKVFIKADSEGENVYFFPFKDGTAHIGYVSELTDDLFYFTGFDVDEKYSKELDLIVKILDRNYEKDDVAFLGEN